MKLRSPVDILHDYRMIKINGPPPHEDLLQLRRDVKAVMKNMREYVAYLIESGQKRLCDATDQDILEFEDVSRNLTKMLKISRGGQQ